MRATSRVLISAGAVAAFSLGAAPAALAQQACDEYSGGCGGGGAVVQAPAENGEGAGAGTVGNNSVTPSTLPFTGGEVVLLAAAGVGAVAVGALAVRAGRRRVSPAV